MEQSGAGVSPVTVPHLAYEPSVFEVSYNEQLNGRIIELVGSVAGNSGLSHVSVLDVGPGRGELLKELTIRGISCMGLELDPVCAKMSQKYAPCGIGDLAYSAAPIKPGSFEVVVASHILEHMPAPVAAVERLKVLSKRWLVLVVPNLTTPNLLITEWYKYWTRDVSVLANSTHVCGWNASHFRVFLESHCGLKIVEFPRDHVIPPLPARAHDITYHLFLPLYRLFARVFPTYGHSLIALCEILGKDQ